MASWLLACAPGPRDPEGAPSQIGARERLVLSDGWLAMGTFFEVDLRVPASERSAAREWISGLRAEIARLESLYSRHDPDSALSALNRRLAEPGPLSIELEPELSGLIDAARRLSEETEGAFDATIGPLVELWWEAARDGREPESATLESARRRVGSSRFALSRAGRLESETGESPSTRSTAR